MTTLNRVFVLEENGTCMKHQTTSKNQFLKKFRKKEELKSQSQEFYESLFEKHQQSFLSFLNIPKFSENKAKLCEEDLAKKKL